MELTILNNSKVNRNIKRNKNIHIEKKIDSDLKHFSPTAGKSCSSRLFMSYSCLPVAELPSWLTKKLLLPPIPLKMSEEHFLNPLLHRDWNLLLSTALNKGIVQNLTLAWRCEFEPQDGSSQCLSEHTRQPGTPSMWKPWARDDGPETGLSHRPKDQAPPLLPSWLPANTMGLLCIF